MINKPLHEISLSDLQRLIVDRVAEGKTIEYKRDLPGNVDGGPVKILRSISSLANTTGGDLIYGVAASEGIPTDLPGIPAPSEDEIRLRLENLCRDGLEPRLPHFEFCFVPVAEGKSALIVRVRRSWNAPHRVITGNHSQFYGRNSAGAYPLDVGELRAAFNLSESVASRIRAFRAERMLAVAEDRGPVPLMEGAKLIFHIIPLSAFVSHEQPLSFQENQSALLPLSPIGASGWDQKYTLEGYASFSGRRGTPSRAYTLTFRSGIVEAVAIVTRGGDRGFIHPGYEAQLLSLYPRYMAALAALGIEPPAYLMLSFVGVAGYCLYRKDHWPDEYEPIRADSISIPEVLSMDNSAQPAALLQPLFDIAANAFGFEGSNNYDSAGNWVGNRD